MNTTELNTREHRETAGREEGPSEAAGGTTMRSLAGWTGGLILGAVLVFGAWAKILDPSAFAEQITNEGLDFLLPAGWVALIAIALEVGLGFALLLGLRKRGILAASGLLVIFFLFLTGRAYIKYMNGTLDESHGCGCFGNLVQRTPAEAFWQDLFLLVPPWLLAAWGRVRGEARSGAARWAVVAVATIGGLLLSWKSPDLPLDDLATTLGEGVEVADLCTGADEERLCLETVAPELATGRHLVVVTELDTPDFLEAVDGLNAMAMQGEGLMVLAEATIEESQAFFWEYAPSFEIREAPGSLLAPMYRTLPRSFVVVDGRIEQTHVGLPDLPEYEDPLADLATGDPSTSAGDGAADARGGSPTTVR